MKWMIIRHGATAGNARKQYIGTTDQPLTEHGIRELREKKDGGSYREAEKELEKRARLFVSPLLRCRQTAELIFPGLTYTVIDELREVDFGEFEGKSYDELNGNKDYQAWIDSDGKLPFPGGESRESFGLRVLRGVDRIREILENDRKSGEAGAPSDGEQTVVIVAHGGTIMAMNQIFQNGNFFDGLTENGCMQVFTDRN